MCKIGTVKSGGRQGWAHKLQQALHVQIKVADLFVWWHFSSRSYWCELWPVIFYANPPNAIDAGKFALKDAV